MNRAARHVDANLTWHMCYGNAREFDCLYPQTNAVCLAVLFESGRPIDWTEIHFETARPQMAEMDILAKWARRDGKYLGIGVIEVMNSHVWTPDEVAEYVRKALNYVEPGRVIISTGCGPYQLAHDIAFRKLCNLVKGVREVRQELGRRPDGTARTGEGAMKQENG